MSEHSTLPETLSYAMKSYLNAAFTLHQNGEVVTTLRLSHMLSRSPASVTNMSKRLHNAQLVRHTRYHGIELTERGLSIARKLVCRRRLLEHYLAEALGYSVADAGADAERLELYISDEFESRVRAFLNRSPGAAHIDPIAAGPEQKSSDG